MCIDFNKEGEKHKEMKHFFLNNLNSARTGKCSKIQQNNYRVMMFVKQERAKKERIR
jgi:hypothetical protein